MHIMKYLQMLQLFRLKTEKAGLDSELMSELRYLCYMGFCFLFFWSFAIDMMILLMRGTVLLIGESEILEVHIYVVVH